MFQYILFAATKLYVLLCRIPSAIQSYVTDWVPRTAREQYGGDREERAVTDILPGMCTFGVKRLY